MKNQVDSARELDSRAATLYSTTGKHRCCDGVDCPKKLGQSVKDNDNNLSK
ncbi:MAG: hypothetical protein Q4C95_03750 [Planctomycetia bacterium]|nr:hypothetical protein [Planctomycetia bacterium]